jgi:conjugative relaxase-like TrwC/TraI family protein
MLRIIVSASVGQAKKYYSEGLTREGYYAEGQEMAGLWGGIASHKLGLVGSVDKDAFSRLCENRHPVTGQRLTPRTPTKRRVGYDFNFHVPKSVTLAYEYHGDKRILTAFRQAVRETMEEMEQAAQTRVRGGGRDEDRMTGNLIWAEFIHFTARPVDGIPDPHLHAHCFVFNATLDPVERRWKALQLGDVKADAAYYEAAFRMRLAEALQKLGYQIELVGGSFEIGGISRGLIEKFSRRSHVVEAKAKELGALTAAQKDGLAALTREKKVKSLSKPELHPVWWSRLSPEDKRELGAVKPVLGRSYEIGVEEPDRSHEAVKSAVKHLFYTASLVTERELIAEALKWGYGRATLKGIKAALKEVPLIRTEKNGQTMVTTAEVLLEEDRIIQRCQKGLGKFPSLNRAWLIQDRRLNGQQMDAVFHVLCSCDFITGVVGKAGVGKTTTLQETARGIEAAGHKVMAFAPTARAARGTLRKSGFENAETIERLLVNPALQEQARGAVWFIDEYGLASARSTDSLLALAENLGARIVVVGDTGQHHSVERGDAFRLLQKFGGLSVATIDKIQRQQGMYRTAVEQISKNDFEGAFETLDHMGGFREIEDNEKRYSAIAADYVATVKTGKTALLVAPTHMECEVVTRKVRHTLKENGTLDEGKKWPILRNLSWSPAQKEDVRHYTPGMVVKVSGHVKGFALGEHLSVVKLEDDKVLAKSDKGHVKALPLHQSAKFNVYQRDTIEICAGERLRITANTRTADRHELENGSSYNVKGFSKDGRIVLENGWKLERNFGHLDYGYTHTSNVAQSATVDVILVAQSGRFSSGASYAQQFYTSVSRGKEAVRIYTDDIEGLRENVARVRTRLLATEVVGRPERGITMEM